jgi:PAS domain S-box-containing protein
MQEQNYSIAPRVAEGRGSASDCDAEIADKYFTLFEQASDGVHTYDFQGNFLDVNLKLCEMLGYTRAELLRLNVRDLIPASDLKLAPLQLEELRAGETIISERQICRKDGTLVQVEISGKMISPNVLLAIIRDVTERKRTEKLLDAQKQSLEMLVKGASLAEILAYLTGVVEKQADGRVIAAILLLDEEGRLRNGASPSLPEDYIAAIDGIKAEPNLGTCSAAAALGKVVITPDIAADPNWESIKDLPLGLGLPAAWSMPILARNGRVLGTFGTYFKERRQPTVLERQVVEILARTAALAIEGKRSEAALRESEEWLRAIFAASRDGILVEDDEQIIYVNKAYAQLFGYSDAEELIGRNVSVVIANEDAARLLQFGRQRTRNESTPSIYEFRGKRKDGTHFDVEATVSTSSIGERSYITTMVRDITERREAQQALRDSETRYRLLFECNPLPLWVYDLETLAFLAVNDAAVEHYGYSREEFLRMTLKDIRPAEDVPLLLENLSKPQTGFHLSDICWRHRKKDGTIIDVEIACHSMVFADRNAEVVLARDVTESKRHEETLRETRDQLEMRVHERTSELAQINESLEIEIRERRQAQEARRQLLDQLVTAQEDERGRISRELHDQMGQHLTAIMLLIDSLKRTPNFERATSSTLDQLEEVTDQLADEVESLAWELRPTALDDLGLEAALNKYVRKWGERSLVPVDLQTAGLDNTRLPPLIETAIYRIVQEALTNIMRYARASTVGIILERQKNHVSAIVEDNGCGFDVDALQATPSVERRMGLLGMQERAALVGGTLHIESASGAGTTVYLRIPFVTDEHGGMNCTSYRSS